ncbi:MAG: hypothetical protein N3A69_02450, partial [Leptospiraceae bacterium]|nr:hypothetical protein [Leptospiraceae bacterium]
SYLFQFELIESSLLHKNLANIAATEIALILSYILHKKITWLESWRNFFYELFQFHKVLFLGLIFRIFIFFCLSYFGFNCQHSYDGLG